MTHDGISSRNTRMHSLNMSKERLMLNAGNLSSNMTPKRRPKNGRVWMALCLAMVSLCAWKSMRMDTKFMSATRLECTWLPPSFSRSTHILTCVGFA
ncbi:hypothetical protein FR483_n148R [Paramecium bursaria Chlorella virus FR483]|uniref:Uncharacterized protein n148R n=1 Tax=Paramecium bursaria Chlorella virus FR483 TaxID=399781 RepID=A7J6K2_PBCVF|nr:hypothetical protein FR483_n148R [Paramecium bursaria Chlorella virus FR483]ABT15433.1 hypothetical protein FR483_n148R [Paramecium bursaria Chlorella virus FR483]